VQRIVIFGTADFAQVAHAYLSRDGRYRIDGFTVDASHLTDSTLLGLPVLPFEEVEQRFPPTDVMMLVAVGYSRLNRARTNAYRAARERGYRLVTYVDPWASCVGPVSLGDNCFVLEQNVIQPFVTIGNNVVLWSGNHIGHHSTIADNCYIASHAVIAGHVTIGENCFIGINATIRDGVTIAPDCIIGAGVTLQRSTGPGEVYRADKPEPLPHSSRRWKV
jgi:sugar O-acyltransferase (sialic acid O-acetyltransferase NeuD family)